MGCYSLMTLLFLGLRYAFLNPAPLEELTVNVNLRNMPKDGEITEYETFDEDKETKAGQIAQRIPVVIGGLDINGDLQKRDEVFNELENKWKTMLHPGLRKSGMGVAFLHNYLYGAGGQAKNHQALSSVFSRTLSTRWKVQPSSLKIPREITALNTIEITDQGSSQKTLMVTGGLGKNQKDMNSSEIRIPSSSETGIWSINKHDMIKPRSGHAAVWFNGRLYVLGGNIQSGQSTEYFNPTDSTWNEGPLMNEIRTFHAATVLTALDSYLYVCGGEKILPDGSTVYLKSCEVGFVLGQGFVTSVTDMPVARSQFAMLTVGTEIWAIGGYNGVEALADVDIYHSGPNTWTPGPKLTSPRRLFGATIVEMITRKESAQRIVSNSTV